jgi:hypothetical protein
VAITNLNNTKCASCPFFFLLPVEGTAHFGKCRRHAPTINADVARLLSESGAITAEEATRAQWPTVSRDDVCAEHPTIRRNFDHLELRR